MQSRKLVINRDSKFFKICKPRNLNKHGKIVMTVLYLIVVLFFQFEKKTYAMVCLQLKRIRMLKEVYTDSEFRIS